MGRLIDIDTLKESLGPIALLVAYRDDECKVKRIKDAIDNQPTAYDVDKVVEKLEETVYTIRDTYGLDDNCTEDYIAELSSIVKGGGQDG